MKIQCFILVALAVGTSACVADKQPAGEGERGRSAEPPRHARPDVQSYADVVDRVSPSVVTIRSERRVRVGRQYPFTRDPSIEEFFAPRFRAPSQPESRVQRGLGSGVIVHADGYCVTNHHVIDGAEEIVVEFADGRTEKAKLVGSDPPSDLAVLKVDTKSLKTVRMGDSDQVRVGDVALAIGNPLGVGQTVTAGIISAKGRTTGMSDGSFEDFLQTDAPINQGNSGGALVNSAGELIGINSQILSPSGGNIGIGFAIPVNMMKDVLDQLVKTGRVRRGQLGVTVQAITPDLASALKLESRDGVLVGDVTPRGPADRAGIRSADVITTIDGQKIDSTNRLRNIISSMPPGSEATVTVIRDGSRKELKVRLGEFQSANNADPEGLNRGSGGPGLGLAIEPITPESAARRGVKQQEGLLVRDVDPAGPAAQAGITAGDVILQANRKPLKGVEDLQSIVRSAAERPIPLLVSRAGRNFFVVVKPR